MHRILLVKSLLQQFVVLFVVRKQTEVRKVFFCDYENFSLDVLRTITERKISQCLDLTSDLYSILWC